MKALIYTILIVFYLGSSAQASTDCRVLKLELLAMKKAQTQIMNSLVNNHEMFAESFEEYSDLVLRANGNASLNSLSKSMDHSAKVVRVRGLKAKALTVKFNKATAELIHRLVKCL